MKLSIKKVLLGGLVAVLANTASAEKDDEGKRYGKGRYGKPLTINILHMNDHHSHLSDDKFDLDVSGMNLWTKKSDGTPLSEVEVTYGGFPLLVNTFQRMERKVKNPIKIHAGDAITGTLYYSLFKGEADAAVMNEICFDAFAPRQPRNLTMVILA